METETQIAILNEKITEEVQEATENYNLAIKQKNVYQKAELQATENYRIVLDKYNNGLSNTNDLLEANVEQLQAKINQVVGDAEELLAIYEYYYTTGILTENVQ